MSTTVSATDLPLRAQQCPTWSAERSDSVAHRDDNELRVDEG
jgi:hypothetical protein